jgi:hypothetical protein
MPFFRFPDEPAAGYFLGTFLLACASVIIGEYSVAVAFRFNKKKIDSDNKAIEHYQNLSVEALISGDKAAYKACNSIANDAYGKTFFSQIALSASSLWPVFFALGWMQYRFSDMTFKLPLSFFCNDCTVGYSVTFFTCYVITRLFTGLSRKKGWSVRWGSKPLDFSRFTETS